jgi:phenylacetic acid degradation operon negative regulatory protein
MTTAVPLATGGRAGPDGLGPRPQSGGLPQHLLVTLLGDYWFGQREQLPSAGLVDLLGEFGISASGARAALGRLARRQLLEPAKAGRRTYYGLTPTAERLFNAELARIMSFGAGDGEPWDGTWLVVAFSVPEEQRDLRHLLRSRLRWQGFAPLYDGVWVAPGRDESAVSAIMADVGVRTVTLLRATALAPGLSGPGHPLSAWNLGELRGTYEQFVSRFAPVLDRVRLGQVTASEALIARTELMDTWRRFPSLDPELPASVLPAGWPRGRSRDIFRQVYDGLGPLAELRVRQLVAAYSPEIADRAEHHTTASALGRTAA